MKLILAAAEDGYYREKVAPHVDGTQIVYFGEADHAAKVKLYGGARALLYPIQAREPFGLVLAEAMGCGTPVAALDRGAVREIVDDGVTGVVFNDLDEMAKGLPRVYDLDRRKVRDHAVRRFGADRMVDEYVAVYQQMVEKHRGAASNLAGKTVVAVFAHPDDDRSPVGTSRLQRRCACRALCASHGERGPDGARARRQLGGVRSEGSAPPALGQPRAALQPPRRRSPMGGSGAPARRIKMTIARFSATP